EARRRTPALPRRWRRPTAPGREGSKTQVCERPRRAHALLISTAVPYSPRPNCTPQAVRRYRLTERAANTTVMPMIHASAANTLPAVGPPSTRALTAFTVAVSGWWPAYARSGPGTLAADTNALEAHT